MKWRKGKSGNPKGRPPGTHNRRLAMFRSHLPQLQRKLLDMALKGDVGALKIIFDRLVPKARSVSLPVRLDGPEGTLAERGKQILSAAFGGQLSPDTATAFLQGLRSQADIVQFCELESRLRALEGGDSDAELMALLARVGTTARPVEFMPYRLKGGAGNEQRTRGKD